ATRSARGRSMVIARSVIAFARYMFLPISGAARAAPAPPAEPSGARKGRDRKVPTPTRSANGVQLVVGASGLAWWVSITIVPNTSLLARVWNPRYGSRVRLLCISDIHGREDALAAVLATAERRGYSHLLVAGDLCFPGPAALAVWRRLAAARATC